MDYKKKNGKEKRKDDADVLHFSSSLESKA